MHYANLTSILRVNQNQKLANRQPIRILHVVGQMHRGGIETWLMQILENIDRDRFQMDFLVHTAQPCAYDDKIRAFGSRIIPCPYLSQPWIYASKFKRILHEYGPYDIVHSHVHHFSGYILRLAQQAGVTTRIVNSHTDTSSIEAEAGLYRQLYYTWMKWWIGRYGTLSIAGSHEAGENLFSSSQETETPWHILDYGIDLTPFRMPIDSVSVRTELGIPPDAFVIGHVGRFVEVKNHEFILEIVAEVAKKEPKIYLLLVGDGPLRQDIEQTVVELGLTNRVIFAGIRSDVPRLMRGAMNVFLFPSLYEGLGNVRIEAQAAGLPSFVSDVVPQRGDVVKALVQRMSLSQSAVTWAEAILATKEISEISQKAALSLVEQSSFNIQTSVKDLEKLYLK